MKDFVSPDRVLRPLEKASRKGGSLISPAFRESAVAAVQKKGRLEGVGGEVHAWPELGAGDGMVSKINHGSSLLHMVGKTGIHQIVTGMRTCYQLRKFFERKAAPKDAELDPLRGHNRKPR